MTQKVVRYKTKPESTETNAYLVEQVFKELHAGRPKNLRYLVLRLEDGSFLHILSDETDGDSPLRPSRVISGVPKRHQGTPR